MICLGLGLLCGSGFFRWTATALGFEINLRSESGLMGAAPVVRMCFDRILIGSFLLGSDEPSLLRFLAWSAGRKSMISLEYLYSMMGGFEGGGLGLSGLGGDTMAGDPTAGELMTGVTLAAGTWIFGFTFLKWKQQAQLPIKIKMPLSRAASTCNPILNGPIAAV
jgi:hypothetical protein